mmetsp:Transcript_23151/g.37291  ORF Transcript_23151/g.37291 Transcript_23151/m.37291 type:complete len:355 (-) Transcript_23151:116-1180(-)
MRAFSLLLVLAATSAALPVTTTRQRASTALPNLSFFTELTGRQLLSFVKNDTLIRALRALNATVYPSMSDFSDERIEAIRYLNHMNVSVGAWLVMPMAEGYWFNEMNAFGAKEQIAKFVQWADSADLDFSRSPYGKVLLLDMEVNRTEMESLVNRNWIDVARDVAWTRNIGHYEAALANMSEAVRQAESAGYAVQAYEVPLLLDQRAVKSTLISRVSGLVDVADPMGPSPSVSSVGCLYSTLTEAGLASYVHSYKDSAVALGSTGGINGVSKNLLDWPHLARDLLLSRNVTENIFIYSLEGCAVRGHLQRIVDFEWSAPLPSVNKLEVEAFNMARAALREAMKLDCKLHPSLCG